MGPGLPGLGLGGLFFVVSALAAPVIELWHTLHGRSSRAAWRRVGRQLAIALTMVCALDLSLRAAFLAAGASGIDAPAVDRLTVLPLTQSAVAFGALASLLVAAKLAQLAFGRPMHPDHAAPAAFSQRRGAGEPRTTDLRRSADGQEDHEIGRAGGGNPGRGRAGERDGRERRPFGRQNRRRRPGHGRLAAELLDRGRQRGT